LESKIEELKKKIEELTSQQGQGGQGVETSTSNIYVHKPTPLKNWNMSLRNSLEVGVNNYVKSICINHEEDIAVFGTKNGTLITYRLSTLEPLNSNQIHTGTIKDITYLFDGKHVISAGTDGKIIKTNVLTNKSTESNHILPAPIKSITYALDGKTLLVASGRVLYFYDINNLSGQYEHKLVDFDDELLKVLYIRDFKLLALGFRNGSVKLIDPATKTVVKQFNDHNGKRITDLAITKFNGATALATSGKDMMINVYDLDEKVLKSSVKVASKTSSHASKMIYGHDEKTVFTLHDDGKIILNQYQTGSLDKETVNKPLISNTNKLSAGFYAGDGSTFIVAMQADQEGGKGKIEIYNSK